MSPHEAHPSPYRKVGYLQSTCTALIVIWSQSVTAVKHRRNLCPNEVAVICSPGNDTEKSTASDTSVPSQGQRDKTERGRTGEQLLWPSGLDLSGPL